MIQGNSKKSFIWKSEQKLVQRQIQEDSWNVKFKLVEKDL